jgi:hypothetical protein
MILAGTNLTETRLILPDFEQDLGILFEVRINLESKLMVEVLPGLHYEKIAELEELYKRGHLLTQDFIN